MSRVRFAPSPTGFIHLGGLRTAFVNFVYARKTGGQFLVRIEDTDRERVVPGSYEDIRDSLAWLGLNADEAPWLPGYENYIQSRRAPLYREKVDHLLSKGSAYRCFCTERRLEILRKEALRNGRVPRYDGRCSRLSRNEITSMLAKQQPFTIRFAMQPGSDSDTAKSSTGKQSELSRSVVRFVDMIHGEVEFDASSGGESDPIILKSDGFPVYHLANVVDDKAMRITTVLRGAEWLVSTPKHIRLYEAFEWQPPAFGHLPLLLTTDRRKLSKRDDAMRVSELRRAGFEPLVILNALARTCSIVSADDDETILPLADLIDRFEVSNLRSRSAILEPTRIAKLNATLVQRAIRDAKSNDSARRALLDRVRSVLRDSTDSGVEEKENVSRINDEYLWTMLTRLSHRIVRFTQLGSTDFRYLFMHPTAESLLNQQSLEVLAKQMKEAQLDNLSLVKILGTVCEQLLAYFKTAACAAQLERCAAENDHKTVTKLLRSFHADNLRLEADSKISFGFTMKLLRHAISGLGDGPSVGEMLCTLGYSTICARLENAAGVFANSDLHRALCNKTAAVTQPQSDVQAKN